MKPLLNTLLQLLHLLHLHFHFVLLGLLVGLNVAEALVDTLLKLRKFLKIGFLPLDE